MIAKCFINLEKIGLKEDEIQIECCNIGYLEEYDSSQHDKSLREVVRWFINIY